MKRYRVRVDYPDGSWETVTVWASDPETAHREVVDWIDFAHRRPAGPFPYVVEEIGRDPSPNDLGIALTNPSVDHHLYTATGEPVSTAYRVEPQEVLRSTEALRTARGDGWDALRLALERAGYRPSEIAHVSRADGGDEPPLLGFVVNADGEVLSYRRFELDRTEPSDTITLARVGPKQMRDEVAVAMEILGSAPPIQAPRLWAYTIQFWPITAASCAYRVTTGGPVELAISLAARRHVEEMPGKGLMDVKLVGWISEADDGHEGDVVSTDVDPNESAAGGHAPTTLRWTVAFGHSEGEPITMRVVTATTPRAIAFATAGLVANHGDVTISEVTIPRIEYDFTMANDDIVDYYEIA